MGNLYAANAMLATFATAQIDRRIGGWYVCWKNHAGEDVSKRWCTSRGSDFYPPWHHQYPGGGTSITALSQLIRWLRGQTVFPIHTWRYWATDTIKLTTNGAVDRLLSAGYPEDVPCVLCGDTLNHGMDWWNLDGVVGPCCDMNSGCMQRGRVGSKPSEGGRTTDKLSHGENIA